MITDLANLGPSLRGTTDLGGARGREKSFNANAESGKPAASSFDQILQQKVSTKPTSELAKSDRDVRANAVSRESVSETRDRQGQRADPEKVQKSSSKNEPWTARQENKGGEEPGSVKKENQSEKVGKKSDGSQTREKVMLEFMDSMESEFGIPPERMVEAMTNIPVSDQLSSPEESASQVIAQLNLPEDQEQRALALYAGMLAKLQQPAQEPVMMKTAVLGGTAASLAGAPGLLSSKQRRDALNNSLDSMNQKFFMQPAPGLKGDSAVVEKALGQDLLSADSMPKDQVSFGSRLNPNAMPSPELLNGEMPNLSKPATGLTPEALQNELQMSQMDPNSTEAKQLAKALAALSASATALDQGLRADPINAQALKAEQVLSQPGMNANSVNAAAMAPLGMGNSGENEMEDWGDGESSQQNFNPASGSTHLNQHQRNELTGAGSFGALVAGSEGRKIGEADQQANLQQIMNQAQYMIKKGGGEAKIQMAPEGIGQVHMKLSILDGKVNLEMSAETKEAKKLIENSLHELKSGLGQHKLVVDQVKVDVGNQLANDGAKQDAQSQQKQQMDMRQDQGRDQAREFWSQFQDNRGFDRRGAFFDSPGIRAYGGSSRQVEALTPTSPGAVAEKRYAGSGKGRGLNLVA